MMQFHVIKNMAFGRTGRLNYFVCCCFLHLFAQAQQQETLLVQGDSSWRKEDFSFPLSFAPEIAYKGVEEAWFPEAWADKDSESFWSYVFAWRIGTPNPLTAPDLEQNLGVYFDGLMRTRAVVSQDTLPPTRPVLVKSAQNGNRSAFTGKLHLFDAFTLNAPLMLYVAVEQVFCKARFTSILLFRFSPKAPEHPLWKQLQEFTLRKVLLATDSCF